MKSKFPWLTSSIIIVFLMTLPLAVVVLSFFTPNTETWKHIRNNLLLTYTQQTILLLFAVLFCTIILASLCAWFVTAYKFPGSRFLTVGLVLPLAIPSYIGGYTYVSMTGYTGVIQVILRDKFGISVSPNIFDMHTFWGAVFVFTIFLYPYIFLVVRAFLDRQANQLLEAVRVLGSSRRRAYFTIVLPLTRNAVIAGSTLVAFEVLSDYGVSSYFGLQVFTTAIFKSWIGLNDITSALRLAAILLLFVTIVSVGEKTLRGRRSHSYANAKITPLVAVAPRGFTKVFAFVLCWGVFVLGLVIPVIQMVYWAIISFPKISLDGLFATFLSSMGVAVIGALIVTMCAFIIGQNQRLWPTKFNKFLARITVMGYSVPSTVIALSILSILMWIGNKFNFPILLTPAIVVFAYVIRYLAVSMQSVESGFERIGTQFHESSRVLGHSPLATSLRIDMPMMKSAMIGAFLLSFMDMVKELPMVLILRPFNFSTLSTRVFEYAHDEQIPESSLASLLIILLALLPVLLLLARNNNKNSEQK